ncbi:MAG: SMP-30/gluconolactonase/LRE family protein [Sporichthyaceae bacterium]
MRARTLRSALLTALTSLSLIAALSAAAPSEANRPVIGATDVLAKVPYPGQPYGLLVEGNTVWTTPAAFGQVEVDEWPIRAYDLRTGRERTAETMKLRRPGLTDMALAGMARDSAGRFYALDMNGRLLRTTDARRPAGGREWVQYGTIPGLATIPAYVTWPLRNSMPIDITFDAAGNAYIADFNHPTIWRIPAGGGAAQPWFVDLRLQGLPFGTGAVEVSPDGKELFFSSCLASSAHALAEGVLYRMPLDSPKASAVTEVYRSEKVSCPDAILFGESGKIYLSMFYGNQIVILRPDGTEERRIGPSSPGQDIPLDQPGALAFDGRGNLLVANQALFPAHPENWALLRVFVGDDAAPVTEPDLR